MIKNVISHRQSIFNHESLIINYELLITNFALFLFVLVSSLVLPSQTRAATIDLAVSPPTAFLKVKPGSQATHTIVVENKGIEAVVVTPKLVDFHSDGKTGRPVLGKKLTFPYFKLPEGGFKPIKLDIGQKAQVNLVVDVPANAVNQEYPIAVILEASNQDGPNKDTTVLGAVASNLVILVTDVPQPELKLNLKAVKLPKIIDSFKPLNFKLLVENTGQAAAVASGSAVVKNWQGKTLETLPIWPTTVLAASTRYLETATTSSQNTKVTEAGIKPQVVFTTKKSRWLGYYQLEVNLNNQKKTYTFFALPLALVVLSLIGVGIGSAVWWIKHDTEIV